MNQDEDVAPREAAVFAWRPTNAPVASSRTDDVWFIDAQCGWIVNSNGHVLHTTDGGETWRQQFFSQGAYLRCVAFADERRGWVGTLDAGLRLLHTADGGEHWQPVGSLPPDVPPAICGLSIVGEQVLYAAGSNFADMPPGVAKSTDGGATWTAIPLAGHATMLVDVYFRDELRGWVVGGRSDVPRAERDNVRPVVLATEDGGRTWEDRLGGLAHELPSGEWGWKIHFVNERVGYVSLENFADGAVLRTGDGGRTWARKAVTDQQGNANLEGIGFVDERHGWVGGWGDKDFSGGFTSETRDGGETWTDANEVGRFLNRFRFVREPELVAYAAGDTVYKYSAEILRPGREAALQAAGERPSLVRTSLPVRIPVRASEGAGVLRVDVWDRFGRHLATPLLEDAPAPGEREVVWSGQTDAGASVAPGIYIYRVTLDERAESRTVLLE